MDQDKVKLLMSGECDDEVKHKIIKTVCKFLKRCKRALKKHFDEEKMKNTLMEIMEVLAYSLLYYHTV